MSHLYVHFMKIPSSRSFKEIHFAIIIPWTSKKGLQLDTLLVVGKQTSLLDLNKGCSIQKGASTWTSKKVVGTLYYRPKKSDCPLFFGCCFPPTPFTFISHHQPTNQPTNQPTTPTPFSTHPKTNHLKGNSNQPNQPNPTNDRSGHQETHHDFDATREFPQLRNGICSTVDGTNTCTRTEGQPGCGETTAGPCGPVWVCLMMVPLGPVSIEPTSLIGFNWKVLVENFVSPTFLRVFCLKYV